MRDAHKRIDPQLAPAAEAGTGRDHRHEVACLLPGQTRRALWAALQGGAQPEAALAQVELPQDALDREAIGDAVAATAATEAPEGGDAAPEETTP